MKKNKNSVSSSNQSKYKNKIMLLCLAAGVTIIAAMATALVSCSRSEPLSETRFMLDTVCTVTLYEWDGDGEGIIDGVFTLCGGYDRLLSATASGSDIFRINHSEGKPVQVSDETAALLGRAVEYCKLSEGEFDITVFPVKSLWDFSGASDILPETEQLAHAANNVDYTRLAIEGNVVTLPKGMGIDLGGIAKGYIADRISEYLREEGVRSAIIDLGGNIYVLGSKPDGSKWRVGIKKPFAEGQADVVEVSDASVVTSGIYQRYFEIGGKIYHHILRPSDGMPCDTGLYSVTVISKSSEQCDALSTVCMLLGYDRSAELLQQFEGVSAVFILDDESILYYQ